MKKNLTILFLVMMAVMFLLPQTLFAQTDTLEVYSTDSGAPVYINEVIAQNPGYKVYKLMSRDASYFYNGAVDVKSDIEIYGDLDPVTKRPPVIQPLLLDDSSVPQFFLIVSEHDVNVTLKNLFLLGKSQANTLPVEPACVSVTADDVHVAVDNCVFDTWIHFVISYEGKNDSFTLTNNVFRNGVTPGNNPWVGEVLRNLVGVNPTGDVVFANNTMLNINCYSVCTHTFGALNKSLVFDHNTVVYGTKNPFFMFYSTDIKVTNNIFYSTFCSGGNEASITGNWDDLDGAQIGVISLDTLNSHHDSLLVPDAAGQSDFRAQAAAARKIVVKNNAYFWPQNVKDLWSTWNASAADADKRVTPVWMNTRTQGMFADDATWPGFDESGNQDVDPGFNDDIKNITSKTTNGFLAYLENTFGGANTTITYDYAPNNPDGTLYWTPAWPLVEDLSYSNTDLQSGGTDGLAVGDLRWYPDQLSQYTDVEVVDTEIPSTFTLDQNYPNPFNPSTKISFGIVEEGNVSLKVYSVNGELVATLVNNEKLAAGTYVYTVDMTEYSSGVYFYTLISDDKIATKKMVLVK